MEYEAILFGAILGFAISELHSGIQCYRDNKEKERRGLKLMEACSVEISEGIKRCKYYIKCNKSAKRVKSYSRIYTAFWDSSKNQIADTIKDIELFGNLHQIYYHFDLINFNMEKDRLGVGQTFAEENIKEIKKNHKKLGKYINKLRKKLG